jgi:DNA-binding LacI/PurR family transcriptional regulator
MPDHRADGPSQLAGTPRQPVIGLLIDSLVDGYQWPVLRGAMDEAASHGANLLCFAGGVLEAEGARGALNGVFELAGPDSVDALIVMSGAIGNRIGPERLRQYCDRYRPLPMCSVAVPIGDGASVCINNDNGMRAVINHLVRAHRKKRIAFVRGPAANEEAEWRFRVYKETLEASGVAFSSALVHSGDFEYEGGRGAARALLAGGNLPPDGPDAVVAANDTMALGLLDELSRSGIRVPDRLAVVGFDDIEESRFANPPLTTVHQPLFEQGRDAVRVVLDELHGGAPRRVVREPVLVTRSSCGCPARDDGSTTISEQATKRLRAERRVRSFGRAAAAIALAHDLDELSRAVAEHLPALGIARCYVATFDETSGPSRQARLALEHPQEGGRSPAPSWQLQPATHLLRDKVFPKDGARAMAVLPTVFRGEELGVLILELDAMDAYLYETLRDVFTAALAGARRTS